MAGNVTVEFPNVKDYTPLPEGTTFEVPRPQQLADMGGLKELAPEGSFIPENQKDFVDRIDDITKESYDRVSPWRPFEQDMKQGQDWGEVPPEAIELGRRYNRYKEPRKISTYELPESQAGGIDTEQLIQGGNTIALEPHPLPLAIKQQQMPGVAELEQLAKMAGNVSIEAIKHTYEDIAKTVHSGGADVGAIFRTVLTMMSGGMTRAAGGVGAELSATGARIMQRSDAKKLVETLISQKKSNKEIAESLNERFAPELDEVGHGGKITEAQVAGLRRRNEVGVFGGRGATGYKDIEAKGQEYYGHEGLPKFEISDEGMAWKAKMQKGDRLYQKIDHPKLFKNYPQLKNVRIIEDSRLDFGEAFFSAKDNAIYMAKVDVGTPRGLDDLTHEIQHWIQARENFARGGTPDMIRSIEGDLKNLFNPHSIQGIEPSQIAKMADEINRHVMNQPGANTIIPSMIAALKQTEGSFFTGNTYSALLEFMAKNPSYLQGQAMNNLIQETGFQMYLRYAGEVEARNAARRRTMTDAQRLKTHPMETEDIPAWQQTIRREISSLIENVFNGKVIKGGGKNPGILRLPDKTKFDATAAAVNGDLPQVAKILNDLDAMMPNMNPLSKDYKKAQELYEKLIAREEKLHELGQTYEVTNASVALKEAGFHEDSALFKLYETSQREIDRARDLLTNGKNLSATTKARLERDIERHSKDIESYIKDATQHADADKYIQTLKDTTKKMQGQINNPAVQAGIDKSWEKMVMKQREVAAQSRRDDFQAIVGDRELRRTIGRERKAARDRASQLIQEGDANPELIRQWQLYGAELNRAMDWHNSMIDVARNARRTGNPTELSDMASMQSHVDSAMEHAAQARARILELENNRPGELGADVSQRNASQIARSDYTPEMRKYIIALDRVGKGQPRLPIPILFKEFQKAYPGYKFDYQQFRNIIYKNSRKVVNPQES